MENNKIIKVDAAIQYKYNNDIVILVKNKKSIRPVYYAGLAKNYNNFGVYNNSDNTLIFLTFNKTCFEVAFFSGVNFIIDNLLNEKYKNITIKQLKEVNAIYNKIDNFYKF